MFNWISISDVFSWPMAWLYAANEGKDDQTSRMSKLISEAFVSLKHDLNLSEDAEAQNAKSDQKTNLI